MQEAKNRLSELVNQAVEEGPQTITVRGKPKVIVVSVEQFNRAKRRKTTLAQFLLRSPLRGSGIKITRPKDLPRKIEL